MNPVSYVINLFRKINPVKYAKKLGVTIGEKTKLIDNPSWGSEPYLITIGSNSLISGNVTFVTHDFSVRIFKNMGRDKDVYKYGRIRIGDNCFIGIGSTILPGVTVGDNSVIAAGAVVTKSVPSGTVWGGVPARQIMTIEEYEQKLLKTACHADPVAMKYNRKAEIIRMADEADVNR